jgi:hypothetical protein
MGGRRLAVRKARGRVVLNIAQSFGPWIRRGPEYDNEASFVQLRKKMLLSD